MLDGARRQSQTDMQYIIPILNPLTSYYLILFELLLPQIPHLPQTSVQQDLQCLKQCLKENQLQHYKLTHVRGLAYRPDGPGLHLMLTSISDVAINCETQSVNQQASFATCGQAVPQLP